jgi:hypothetical protein
MLFSELAVDVITNIRSFMYYTARKPVLQGKDVSKNKLLCYTIIVPTKCTSLLKAQDITICTFLSLYS